MRYFSKIDGVCKLFDYIILVFFFFQAEDGIRDYKVTGVQTCALPISPVCPTWACRQSPGPRPQAASRCSDGLGGKALRLTDSAPCGPPPGTPRCCEGAGTPGMRPDIPAFRLRRRSISPHGGPIRRGARVRDRR